jgi:hypothetical protein
MLQPLPHTQQVPQAHQSSTYTQDTMKKSISCSQIYHKHLSTALLLQALSAAIMLKH